MMLRSTIGVVAVGAVVTFLAAAPGCGASGIGDPCTPEQEYEPTFNGFDEQEVNVESKSFQCQTRICLVNHFRGRVSCQYGQDKSGAAPSGATDPCFVPGTQDKITGNAADAKNLQRVAAQCKDRIAANAVYCSCRCADINGEKKDGVFCDCPDGFSCTQLVSSIGVGNEGLTGAYCVKNNTQFNRNAGACASSCDPVAAKCEGPQK